MKDHVEHKSVYNHTLVLVYYEVIQLLRQSISYLTLRNEKSMLLHYPRNSSPAKSKKSFKMTDICLGQTRTDTQSTKCQKVETFLIF